MAVNHITHPVYGLQFHPESILTEHGDKIIRNFIHISPPPGTKESSRHEHNLA